MRVVHFDLQITVENRGFSWAEDVTMGSISWTLYRIENTGEAITNHLLSYLDVKDIMINDNQIIKPRLAHNRIRFGNLRAFDTTLLTSIAFLMLPVRTISDWYNYTLQSAIYLICKDTPPIWYQVSIPVNQELLALANTQTNILQGHPLLKFKRLTSERPVVAWSDLQIS